MTPCHSSPWRRPGRRALILAGSAIILLALVGLGCGAAEPRGWSGAFPTGETLYVGSSDGKLLALNMEARSREAPFPGPGEWSFVTKSSPKSAGFACTPATPPTIYGTPAMSDGLVFAANYAGKAYAVNAATGASRWVYPREGNETLGSVVGSIFATAGKLYFGAADSVYALDAPTGDLVWNFKTGGKVWSSPAVMGNVVYTGSFDKNLYALTADQGKELWRFTAPASITSSPAIWEKSVIFGAFDSRLYAVVDGKEAWKFEAGNWFWATPLASGRTVYAASLDGKLYALKADTGDKLWQFDAASPIVSSPVLVGDSLVLASEGGNLFVVNAATGALVRSVPVGGGVLGPLTVRGDFVYAHARNRNLYAVRVSDGSIAWKFSTQVQEK